MRVTVNGEQKDVAATRIDALLGELEFEGTHFAIAVNYDVVPRGALGGDGASPRATWWKSSRRGREADEMVSFYGEQFSSRLLIGTALYPSPAIMQQAIRASGADLVTVSVRRETAGGKTGDAFWSLIRELGVEVLPNTAGCHSVREAVTTAKLARELFDTQRIKLEVIADSETLQPDVVGLVEAASDPDQGRLRGLPLLHRGSRRGAASGRRRLPRHHAVGRSDRQRARHHQSRRAETAAAAAARHHAGGRRRDRRAEPCGRSARARLRRRAAQHGGRQGRRSGRAWRMRSASPSTPAAPRSRPV